MNSILGYLDKTDPTKSLKHAAYAVVILCGCGWLSYDLTIKTIYPYHGNVPTAKEEVGVKRGIDSNWVAAFGLLLAAVTTGKIVGSGPSPAPTTGAVPSTVVEDHDAKN